MRSWHGCNGASKVIDSVDDAIAVELAYVGEAVPRRLWLSAHVMLHLWLDRHIADINLKQARGVCPRSGACVGVGIDARMVSSSSETFSMASVPRSTSFYMFC